MSASTGRTPSTGTACRQASSRSPTAPANSSLAEFPLAFWLERRATTSHTSRTSTPTQTEKVCFEARFPVGGPRRVLDPADVRERDQGARRGRQPGVPLRQHHLRDRGAAAEHRRAAEPSDAQGQGLHDRTRADGIPHPMASAWATGLPSSRITGHSRAPT